MAALLLALAVVLLGAGSAGAAPVADIGQLRAAVDQANGDPNVTSIELEGGTAYSITGDQCPADPQADDEDGNAVGDLDIHRTVPLTIFVPDDEAPASIVVSCANATRAIEASTGALTLRRVIINGGRAQAGQWGGGVRTGGDLTLDRAQLLSNAAGDGSDGTDGQRQGGQGGRGGGVAAGGKVVMTDAIFIANRAGDGGDGRAGACTGEAGASGGLGGRGGAVYAEGGLEVTRTILLDNRSGHGGKGGDGFCDSAGLAGGNGGDAGAGGAVSCVACPGPVKITGSTFSSNETGRAGDGGKGSSGPVTGGDGGDGGDGGNGGALAANVATGELPFLRIDNSTIDATGAGGAAPGGPGGNGISGAGGAGGDGGDGLGAAISASGPDPGSGIGVQLVHVTLTDSPISPAGAAAGGGNPGGAPGGQGAQGGGAISSLRSWSATGSVIGASSGAANDCTQPAAASTYSTSTDESCGFDDPTDLGVQPFSSYALGALTANGGQTSTRLPGGGSVLLDRVPAAACALASDQRSLGRPSGTGCDVGAVEVQVPQPEPVPSPSPSPSPTPIPTPVPAPTPVPSKPSISGFKYSSKKFKFSSTKAADGKITIERSNSGRRKGKSCVSPKKASKKAKRCTRYTKKGTLKFKVKAGSNSVSFNGKISGKRLPSGTYRATIVATDSVGSSKSKRTTFKYRR